MLEIVARDSPHLQRLFEVFAQEARFGRTWLAPSLARLKTGNEILEIGSGLMLLSCQLMKEGFAVTALEPIGTGFSHFSELQELVLNYARERGIAPDLALVPIEEFDRTDTYDFAFSINVMEHVGSIKLALRSISKAIRPGCEYRFTCPNYLFPYEPHFNIPTLLSKPLTAIVFGRQIFKCESVADPASVWRSLNWISVFKIVRAIREMPDISATFDRSILRSALERVIGDKEYSARRSRWMRILAQTLVSLKLHRLAACLPPLFQPIVDCTLTRRGMSGRSDQPPKPSVSGEVA